MNEFIYEKDNALSSETCQKSIEIYDKTMNDNGEFDLLISTVYNSELTNIKTEILTTVNNELQNYYTGLNSNIYFFDIVHNKLCINKITFIKHSRTQKFTEQISSVVVDNKNISVLCFIYFLNTIENGGEIVICNNYKITPIEGKLVIFPSEWFFPYKYLNTPITERYLISGLLYVNRENLK